MEKPINLEAKEIAAGIKLDVRIEYIAKVPAYITLKDKINFRSTHPCRLINPYKSEIGKISINLGKYKQKSSKTCQSKPVEEFGKCH